MGSSTIYYRLSNDIRDLFITFFQKLFVLYEEGKIFFVDGRNKIVFTTPPKCMDMSTYDFKYFPSVLVGLSPGYFKDTHFNKFRGIEVEGTEGTAIYGGSADLTITFQVYALTREDRNTLADLVCTYLAKRDTKALFESQYGLRLSTPTFSGDNTEEDPQTNVMKFFTDISLPMQCDWEDTAAILDSEGRQLTLADVLSYHGDTNADGEIDTLYSNVIP